VRRRTAIRSVISAACAGTVIGSVAGDRRDDGVARNDPAGRPSEPRTTVTQGGTFEPVGQLGIDIAHETVLSGDGTTAFVAAGDGFATVDLSDPGDPMLLTRRDPALADRDDGPMTTVMDVAWDDDRLLVGGPGEDATGFHGLALYDVSDPAEPALEGTFGLRSPVHNCDLDGDYAYHTGPELGIVDVSGESLDNVATWDPVAHDARWASIPDPLINLHDVRATGDRAYLSHWDAGCFVLDVSDPSEPSVLSRAGHRGLDRMRYDMGDQIGDLPGNAHYAETDPAGDLLAVGKEAGDPTGGPGGIDLWDVSDVRDPSFLVTIEPPGRTTSPSGQPLWTTAHNFHLVEDYLYTSWYAGGVRVYDVSDPREPRRLAAWKAPAEGYFWTARLAVPGEYFVAGSTDAGRVDGRQGGVFVFPDPRDRDGDPAATSAATPEPVPTPQSFTPPPTDTPTPTPTATPTETASPTETATAPQTTSSADGSGFGPLAALAGLGLSAWRLRGDGDD